MHRLVPFRPFGPDKCSADKQDEFLTFKCKFCTSGLFTCMRKIRFTLFVIAEIGTNKPNCMHSNMKRSKVFAAKKIMYLVRSIQ